MSNEQQLQQLFTAFDLSAREQMVFEGLMGRGFQPASSLAKALALARNTCRNVLERLVEIGLVARSRRANMHLYRIESLKVLEGALTERHRQIERTLQARLKALQSLEPLFVRFNRVTQKPTVQFYDGLEGAQRVYEDTLTAQETIRGWASFDANVKALPDYFRTYYRRRASRGISIRLIHPDTPLARIRTARNKAELRMSAAVPESILSLHPEIQVYDNKISLVSWEDEFGVLIESEQLARGLKSIFELSFSLALERPWERTVLPTTTGGQSMKAKRKRGEK